MAQLNISNRMAAIILIVLGLVFWGLVDPGSLRSVIGAIQAGVDAFTGSLSVVGPVVFGG